MSKGLPKIHIKLNWKKLAAELKYYAGGIYNKFDEDHIWIQSAGIAFYILICAIPFTLILFSIFGIYLSSENAVSAIDKYLNAVVGITPDLRDKIKNVILSRMDEISSNRTLTAIIGTLGILWTASGLFSTIRDVLNKIYKIDLEVFYVWGKLKDIGMVFVVTVLFLLSFTSTTIISILKTIDEKFFFNTLFSFGFIESFASVLVGLFFTFLMFYTVYRIVPHGKISNKIVLVSSISSTLMWEILKFGFTQYLVHFSNFTAVYGAYAAIAAVIFWVYYSSTTFVLGAEIGQLYHEKILLKNSK
jgi:membrane protein